MKKTYLFLASLFLLLIAAYWGLKVYNDKTTAAETAAEESAVIYLTNEDTLSALSYANGTDTMSFDFSNTTWSYTEDDELKINQTTLQSVAASFTQLTASRALTEGIDDLSDYGLDDPSYTLSITSSEGETTEILIGNSFSSDTYYYAKTATEDTIYVIDASVVTNLVFDVSDLIEIPSLPGLTTDNTIELTRSVGDETISLTADTEASESAEDATADSSEEAESTESSTEDETTSPFEDGITAIASSMIYSIQTAQPTADELESDGLTSDNRKTYTLTYTDDDDQETTFVFYAGNTDEEDTTTYIQVQNNKSIYLVSVSMIEALDAAFDAAK